MTTKDWQFAKSVCKCGHSGDGIFSDHGDTFSPGHGKCYHKGCNCKKFTWDKWTPFFQKKLDEERRNKLATEMIG